MSERVYGCAIVGCGAIASTHAKAINSITNAQLLAVADIAPEKARHAAVGRVKAYFNLNELLARDEIDIVHVCVPSGMHAEVAAQAAYAGKHVLVEKPIDISLSAADRLIEVCRGQGVKLAVMSQHRFRPAVRRLREAVVDGRFSRLVLGDAIVKWYRPSEYYSQAPWRGTWKLDGGGALINQSIHYIDLLQWVMGSVRSVYAVTRTLAHDILAEDLGIIVVRFENGALGTVQGTTTAYPGLPERLEISGTTGTVIIEKGEIKTWIFKDEQTKAGSSGGQSNLMIAGKESVSAAVDPVSLSFSYHRAQIVDFLDAISNDREPLVNGEEARKPLEIVMAAYQSASEGKEVQLPLVS